MTKREVLMQAAREWVEDARACREDGLHAAALVSLGWAAFYREEAQKADKVETPADAAPVTEYTVTITAPGSDTPDIVTTNDAVYAVETIQELTWRDGYTVTYTYAHFDPRAGHWVVYGPQVYSEHGIPCSAWSRPATADEAAELEAESERQAREQED